METKVAINTSNLLVCVAEKKMEEEEEVDMDDEEGMRQVKLPPSCLSLRLHTFQKSK